MNKAPDIVDQRPTDVVGEGVALPLGDLVHPHRRIEGV